MSAPVLRFCSSCGRRLVLVLKPTGTFDATTGEPLAARLAQCPRHSYWSWKRHDSYSMPFFPGADPETGRVTR